KQRAVGGRGRGSGDVDQRADLARVLYPCAQRVSAYLQIQGAAPGNRCGDVALRRSRFSALVRGPHRLSAGRRGDAAAGADRLDAQPPAYGRGDVSVQIPADRLALGRTFFYAASDRWRSRREQRRLAVERIDRHRRGAVFSIAESAAAGGAIR